jgi:AraC-like DNA-binding protein
MQYKEYQPGPLLKDYVQCFFLCRSDSEGIREDKVFATGCVELLFNLGEDGPQQIKKDETISQPDIQLWGQTIQPFTFTTWGKHVMFGIRFQGHSAACFFHEPIESFNNQVVDGTDIGGKDIKVLHSQLREADSLDQQIALVEAYLVRRLLMLQSRFGKLPLMHSVIRNMEKEDSMDNIHAICSQHGISMRYLQKLFLQYAGLSPLLYNKIVRFQRSIHLVSNKSESLTSIAYQCGYFDQSHFIKDFKFFTGSVPSRFAPESSTDLSAMLLG